MNDYLEVCGLLGMTSIGQATNRTGQDRGRVDLCQSDLCGCQADNIGQIGTTQVGLGEQGIGQVCPFEDRFGQVRPGQIGPLQIGPFETGRLAVCVRASDRVVKVGIFQVSFIELGPA